MSAVFSGQEFDPSDWIELDVTAVCAPEWAAYKQALNRVIAHAPDRLARDYGNPLNEMDEQVVALVNAAGYACFREGVRSVFTWAGGSEERPATVVCRTCNGHGRTRDAVCCPHCDGAGTIPAAA